MANVGATVRAMANFGLQQLRLVTPAVFDRERILGMAHRTEAIVDAVTQYTTVDEALADCGFVLATTARSRAVRHERMSPRQAAPALLQAALHAPVAILFGPEDRGLSNDVLGRCNAVITIPTVPTYSSLNLAQAVLVVLYEVWHQASLPLQPLRTPDAVKAAFSGLPEDAYARVQEREEMFAALEMVLWGMHPNNDAGRVGHTLARLRALLLRAAPRSEETAMLKTLFLHIAHERESARRPESQTSE